MRGDEGHQAEVGNTVIAALAKMLRLSTEHAEASMHSDRVAHAVLTRRNLFAAGAALAAGSAFSFAQVQSFTYADWVSLIRFIETMDRRVQWMRQAEFLGGVRDAALSAVAHRRLNDTCGGEGCVLD